MCALAPWLRSWSLVLLVLAGPACARQGPERLRPAGGGQPVPLRIVIEPSIAAAGPPPGGDPGSSGPLDTGRPHSTAEGGAGSGAAAAAGGRRVWTETLHGHEEFLRYSSPVRGVPFTKFVINPRTGKVYFFWTAIYPFHYNFVTDVLLPLSRSREYPDLDSFNRANHAGWERTFILGAIGYQNGIHGYEFLEADTPTPEVLRTTQLQLAASFTGVDLRFRPISANQQALLGRVPEIPWVGADFVTSGATFQCLNEGRAVGLLRVMKPGEDAGRTAFSPQEIVVLDEVPLDIAPVAGILAARLTTPLSHVNLRATAWGVPNAGQVGVHALADPLVGKVVLYEVKPGGLVLRQATPSEQADYEVRQRSLARVVELQLPPADLLFRGLPALEGLTAADAVRVGTKAANLGVLATRGSGQHFSVPPGLAVPFAYYQDHLLAHGLHLELRRLLDDWQRTHDEAALAAALAQLQQHLKDAPLDPAFFEQLELRARFLLGDRGLFVRSSTNAEDLPRFNGAGLYDTVPNVKGSAALAAAVRQVWSSVWNLRAFRERERWGIDHQAVFPGVIVQLGVDAEAAGVLITTDVFQPRSTSGITINAKRGLGIRVVDGLRVPEQVLFDEEHKEIRVISRSDDKVALRFDERGGVREVSLGERQQAAVLDDGRVLRLVAAAQEVRTLFAADQPLDIEWLLTGDQLFLVQARPYVRSST